MLHADETPIQILRPDTGRKTHRAYVWAYSPSAFEDLKAVVYDFAPSRTGEHARAFLADWRGQLVVDDYVSYKKTLSLDGAAEIGCMAHARRKLFDLHAANQSELAAQALDYSLKRWVTLTRYLDDGAVPVDHNHIEQQIRPIAIGRKNWLFADSERAGRRAAVIMSLIQTAKLNGINPHAYLKDVLTRLPMHPNSRRYNPGFVPRSTSRQVTIQIAILSVPHNIKHDTPLKVVNQSKTKRSS